MKKNNKVRSKIKDEDEFNSLLLFFIRQTELAMRGPKSRVMNKILVLFELYAIIRQHSGMDACECPKHKHVKE